jgi:hypothetical protein
MRPPRRCGPRRAGDRGRPPGSSRRRSGARPSAGPNAARWPASSGAIGSSSSHRARGLAISLARARRRRCPADRRRTSRSSRRFRSIRWAARRAEASVPPVHRVWKRSSSQAVRVDFRPSWWPTMCRCSARAVSASTSSNRISPASGRSSPATARSRLVLPAPLRPVRATASPARSSRWRPENSRRSPRETAKSFMRTVLNMPRPCPVHGRSKTSKAKKPSAVTLQTVRGVRGAGMDAVGPPRSRDPGSGFRAAVDREGISRNGVFGQPQNPPRTCRRR